MIICICNNVNTEAVAKALDSGAKTIEALKAETGAATGCGKCQFRLNRVLQEQLANKSHLFYNAVITPVASSNG